MEVRPGQRLHEWRSLRAPIWRWRAALIRAIFLLLTTKENNLSPGAKIARVGRRTSSVTRRIHHVNLHRFWARRPGNGDSRRLGVGLGDSEALMEGNRICLLQCDRLRMLNYWRVCS